MIFAGMLLLAIVDGVGAAPKSVKSVKKKKTEKEKKCDWPPSPKSSKSDKGDSSTFGIDNPILPYCNTSYTTFEEIRSCDTAEYINLYQEPLYCGPQGSSWPTVFGPSVWKLLHTLSLYYEPDDMKACEGFLNGFSPMIPCPHCAYHFNEFLLGNSVDKETPEHPDQIWDWKTDGNPCESKENFQYFFVKAHNNVGQHANPYPLADDCIPTRPTFEVHPDLENIYGEVFYNNTFVPSDTPDVFVPIFVEAFGLISWNYPLAPLLGGSDFSPSTVGGVDVSDACKLFIMNLPKMLPQSIKTKFGIEVTEEDAELACQSNSGMIDLATSIETELELPELTKEDRSKRYSVRAICQHNQAWEQVRGSSLPLSLYFFFDRCYIWHSQNPKLTHSSLL